VPHRHKLLLNCAEQVLHGFDQPGESVVNDTVVNEIRLFAAADNSLVTQDGEVLGNIGIRCVQSPADLSYGHLLILKQTEDMEPERMGDGLQQYGKISYLFRIHESTPENLVFKLILKCLPVKGCGNITHGRKYFINLKRLRSTDEKSAEIRFKPYR
jgi:hypothetical protein